MNPDQVRKIAQDVLQQSQYSNKGIPFHTHNGIDSPQITNHGAIISAGLSSTTLGNNTTQYIDNRTLNTTESLVGNVMVSPYTVKNLYINFRQNTINGTTVFTLMKNSVATLVTATAATSATVTVSDTKNQFLVTGGDRITVKCVSGGTSGSIIHGFSYGLY